MKSKRPKSKLGVNRKKVISDVSPSTSLPPLVEGQVRCFLRVTISKVIWTVSKPPPVTLVRLRWWGESTGGTVFYPRDSSLIRQRDIKSTSRFPVRCGPKQFTSYLTDMGSLVLDVLAKPDHLPIARVQIAGIARLSVSHSIHGFFTLVSLTSEKLGELQVTLALEPLIETYDSCSSVPTTDISVDALPPAPELISVRNTVAPFRSHFGTSYPVKDSGGSSTPRGKDHLYFQEGGNLPNRMQSPVNHDDTVGHNHAPSGGSHARFGTTDNAHVHERNEVDMCTNSAGNHGSVDLLSVLLERGSHLRNAMVVSSLKSESNSSMVLRDRSLPHPSDNIEAPPLLPSRPSSGHLLRNILHSNVQHSSQDADVLEPDYIPNKHDPAVDLLLGSVNGSVLPLWDGEGSPPESLSRCSSVLIESELGDPQYDQSLLETLFYKAPKFDECPSADENDNRKKTNSNERLDRVGQTTRPKDEFPGLSVDRIDLLGSIRLARVVILQLTVPTESTYVTTKVSGKGRPPRPPATKRCTYFVEYLFPLSSSNNETVPTEVTRVASSKVVEGVVNFQHRSVFPVHLSGPTIKHWWGTNLTFTVYCRKSHQKKPVPIGTASFPLHTLLQSNQLEMTTNLPVQRLDGDPSSQNIGPLKVLLELAADKKDFLSKSKSVKTVTTPSGSLQKDPPPRANIFAGSQRNENSGDFPPGYKSGHSRDPSPMSIRPAQSIILSQDKPQFTSPRNRVQTSPLHNPTFRAEEEESDILLHTLLMVPDGKDFHCQPMQPNVYLNCKLFGSDETVRSVVSWGQKHPTFSLVQVAPVTLNSKLLERMKNNVMIIEVWLRASSSDNDKLLGLVKLPLHQFYMSFRDPKICQLLLQAQYPVVAVDSFMPVVDIFTAATRGSLRVCLAMGLSQQIMAFQRMRDEELCSVYQLPRPVHLLDHKAAEEMQANARPRAEVLDEHVFLVRVERVKGLTPLQSTVWGEADCYIQYSFPSQAEEAGQDIDPHIVESSVDLKSYRTVTTLCVPDPTFGHCETHVLLAPPAVPVQRLLLNSLASQGLKSGGGIQFEVWCRYYYPNVREQLVARGVLPMAKLCAMVTMQRQGSTEAQLFSLPLVPWSDRPADYQPQPTGLLEVSVQYKTRPVRSSSVKSGVIASRVVTLLVQVHRATGLQAAARALAMRYYSEVGVNSFVTMQLPFLPERESRSTRVVAKSFCPEFEHHAEFCCQLLVQRDSGESVSLAEMLQEAMAVFTIHHRDTRKVDASGSKDRVLGTIKIRLADLLNKRTGISGWYSLSLPSSVSSHHTMMSVGGLELSINFAHHADRERVLNSAQVLGWEANRDSEEQREEEEEEEGGASLERQRALALSISMPRAWLPVQSLLLPGHEELQRSTYCYYRYKLYDQEAFCSELRHPAMEEDGEDPGLATVAFSGGRVVELRMSLPLRWYLREERLEVQLWVSFGKEKRVRPHDSDRLVGSAYVDLSGLATAFNRKQTISGVYPLFKRSAANLGGAALRVHITANAGSAAHTFPSSHLAEEEEEEEQLNIPVKEEEENRGSSSAQSRGPSGPSKKSPISSRPLTKSVLSFELPPSRSTETGDDNFFTATVSVERAMHLSLKGCPLAERSDGLPSCCVSYATADASGTVTTDVVQDSDCPVWDHQQECRLSKDLLVDPQQSLVFKVWHKGEVERVMGFASVDLFPLLSGFQSVCGWYNITDFSGQCQGQLKVSVCNVIGLRNLQTQRLAVYKDVSADSSFVNGAPPLSYQTTAVYSSFPSHISRFTEQQISASSESLDRLMSARCSQADRHEEHMDNVRHFHQTLHEGESIPLSSCGGDPSTAALYSALRKNLSELDDIQKYFSHKLSTPVFAGLSERGRGLRQEDPVNDTAQLLLKSNRLVGEVNTIIKGLSEQTETSSSHTQRNPSTPAEKELHAFSSRDYLTPAESESESCLTGACCPKKQETRQDDMSPITTSASEEPSHSPIPEHEQLHQDSSSSEEVDKDENEEEEELSEGGEEEEFEETLIEPRPLNEVTSVTDRTSPWTSVLSDPDDGSQESVEMEEQPARDLPRVRQYMEEDAALSPLPLLQPSISEPQRAAAGSGLSDGFESGEDDGVIEDVQSVSEELSDDQDSFAVRLHEDIVRGTKQTAVEVQHDSMSDSEDESPVPLRTRSNNTSNSPERESKPFDAVELPNFFLPSNHLEASMRALRLTPVFPSTSPKPEIAQSSLPYPSVTRPRPRIPPSSAKREETKRIAKIFASHYTEG